MKTSTQSQIEVVRETAEDQIGSMKETTESQIKAMEKATQAQLMESARQSQHLSDGIERLTLVLTKVASLQEDLRQEQEEQVRLALSRADLAAQTLEIEQAREAERVADRTRRRPRVWIRIGEITALLVIQDFWLRIYASGGIADLRAFGRVYNSGTSQSTAWSQAQIRPASLNLDVAAIKFGSIGVRGVYNMAEVQITGVDDGQRVYRGQAILPLAVGNWVEVELQLKS